jgi:hypothetical protein
MKEYKKSLTRKERWVASWRWDPDNSKDDSEECIAAKDFLINERNKLIKAWSEITQ